MSPPESLNAGTTGHAMLLCVDLWLGKAWGEDLRVHCILWAAVIHALQQKVREMGMGDENEKEMRQTLMPSCFSAKRWLSKGFFIPHAHCTGDSLWATQIVSTISASWVPATGPASACHSIPAHSVGCSLSWGVYQAVHGPHCTRCGSS